MFLLLYTVATTNSAKTQQNFKIKIKTRKSWVTSLPALERVELCSILLGVTKNQYGTYGASQRSVEIKFKLHSSKMRVCWISTATDTATNRTAGHIYVGQLTIIECEFLLLLLHAFARSFFTLSFNGIIINDSNWTYFFRYAFRRVLLTLERLEVCYWLCKTKYI